MEQSLRLFRMQWMKTSRQNMFNIILCLGTIVAKLTAELPFREKTHALCRRSSRQDQEEDH
jgi:hypothetical protein